MKFEFLSFNCINIAFLYDSSTVLNFQFFFNGLQHLHKAALCLLRIVYVATIITSHIYPKYHSSDPPITIISPLSNNCFFRQFLLHLIILNLRSPSLLSPFQSYVPPINPNFWHSHVDIRLRRRRMNDELKRYE